MSLAMSKVSDEPASMSSTVSKPYSRLIHVTASKGKGIRQPPPQALAWEDAVESDDDNEGNSEDDDDCYDTTNHGYGHAPAEMVPYSNIQEIIPGLFIGDVTAAMDADLLKSRNITVVVAALRQRYPAHEGIKVHRIFIDDTSKTNILRYFPESNAIIRKARSEGKNVLVHCQAGVSRSSTLCAAFLMEELDLTADEAIEKIASVRSVVQPLEFFLHQLEIFERCNFDLDPNKYAEYRRFLMNFNAQDMIDGDGVDNLILAYYPTPAPSPRRSPAAPDPFLSMTPLNGSSTPRPGRSRRGSSTSITSQEARSEILARVRRGSVGANSVTGSGGGGSGLSSSLAMSTITGGPPSRRMSDGQHIMPGLGGLQPLTRRKSSRTKSTGERDAELKRLRGLLDEKRSAEAVEVAKHKEGLFADQEGSSSTPVTSVSPAARPVRTSKLRCKMCRRELVSREHVLEHDPGQGQKAFAPTRRDMTQHRLDTEKRRLEKAQERELRQVERQRLAAEAAEDLIQEVEDASSGSEDEADEKNAESNTKAVQGEAMQIDNSQDKLEGKEAFKPPETDMNQKMGSVKTTPAPLGAERTSQNARSLSSRLPPQLAALRVALPSRAFGHDFKNAQDGSAIADDDGTPITEEAPLLPSAACTSYFTEPLSWMRPQLENGDISGKLVCPNTKCGAKLGNFDWSGLRCSCAAWISPGFALGASKVDEVRM